MPKMQSPEPRALRLAALARQARCARAAGLPLPSPCVRVCRIDPATGQCRGCQRRLDEITDWLTMDDDRKWAIWQCVQQRVQQRAAAGAGHHDGAA